MPGFPIIDSHVHLYDPTRLRHSWLDAVPAINRAHLPADFDRACGSVAVDKLVFVEVAADPGLHLAEAAFVQGLADADPRIAAIVAHAPVEKGDAVEHDLAALARFPALRGIRRLIQGEPDPGMCLEPGFLAGVRRVGRHGLSFDICVRHWGLGCAVELVRRCPEVMFVLDHIGKPDIRHALREPWWSDIGRLAELPNVVVKLSGVITEAAPGCSDADLAPYIAHVIDRFGFSRVMYGSDWSVSELTHCYADWVAMLDRLLAGTSEAERRSLYHDTATRIYRL